MFMIPVEFSTIQNLLTDFFATDGARAMLALIVGLGLFVLVLGALRSVVGVR